MTAPRKTRIMVVLNITPDSFSDGGQLYTEQQRFDPKALLSSIEALRFDGFDLERDIFDVGGESTRPGAECISEAEEIARVTPAIQTIRKVYPNASISIDTRKAAVAQAALDAGANIINDVSGLQFDASMATVAAQAACPIILMHSVGTPETMQALAQNPATYPDGIITGVTDFFQRQIQVAQKSGIKPENIILDPGFGFGKTLEHNLTLLKRLTDLKQAFSTHSWLIGTSRKSFLTLGNSNIAPKEREALTAASLLQSITHGPADIVRIHDLKTQLPVILFSESLR